MSSCQLRCPTCPTTTGAIHPTIAPGYLRVEQFARLLKDNPWVQHVELSNFGEILLSPDFTAILKAGHKAGVKLSADNGMNLNTATEGQLESLVKFGFHSATISIDGASQGTYEQYRIRGKFDNVIANIKTINRYKSQYETASPRFAWQYVVFGHNQHELGAAREMAESLDMEFRPKLSWENESSPVQDNAALRQEMGIDAASREEYEDQHGDSYVRSICHQLWTEPQVNWDGTILGCCINYWGDFGSNAFDKGLSQAINSEGMTYAREMLLGTKPPREDIPCVRCSNYTSMQTSGRWLTSNEIYARESKVKQTLKRLYKRLVKQWT